MTTVCWYSRQYCALGGADVGARIPNFSVPLLPDGQYNALGEFFGFGKQQAGAVVCHGRAVLRRLCAETTGQPFPEHIGGEHGL